MKKLFISMFAVVFALAAGPVMAQTYEVDFGQDGGPDTSHTMSPGDTVVVDLSVTGLPENLVSDGCVMTYDTSLLSLTAVDVTDGGAGGVKGDDITDIITIKNRNWYVRADSTGDMPTIDQTIREAMPGDTVLVEGGTYNEHLVLRNGVVVLGSWDGDFKKRDLVDTPSIIDATGHHSGVRVMFGEDSTAVLDGFVITGGAGKSGAGIALTNSSSPVLRNLIIHSNSATYGGAMSCRSSSPRIEDVLIAGNRANSGGGIFCSSGASPHLCNVTLAGNQAGHGSAIYASEGSSPYVENSIIADHQQGYGVFTADGSSCISLSCCNLWSNQPDDVGGSAKEPVVLKDNISEDPGFVDPSNMDYSVSADSPMLAVEGCGRIGAKQAKVAGP